MLRLNPGRGPWFIARAMLCTACYCRLPVRPTVSHDPVLCQIG